MHRQKKENSYLTVKSYRYATPASQEHMVFVEFFFLLRKEEKITEEEKDDKKGATCHLIFYFLFFSIRRRTRICNVKKSHPMLELL